VEEERFINIDMAKGKLIEWINDKKTVNFIKRSFYLFLT
jgi:hypothetical protein